MNPQPLRNYEIWTTTEQYFQVNKVSLLITNEGTLVFRDEEDELVDAYSATGWLKVKRR